MGCPVCRFQKSYRVMATTQPEEAGKMLGMEKPTLGNGIGRQFRDPFPFLQHFHPIGPFALPISTPASIMLRFRGSWIKVTPKNHPTPRHRDAVSNRGGPSQTGPGPKGSIPAVTVLGCVRRQRHGAAEIPISPRTSRSQTLSHHPDPSPPTQPPPAGTLQNPPAIPLDSFNLPR